MKTKYISILVIISCSLSLCANDINTNHYAQIQQKKLSEEEAKELIKTTFLSMAANAGRLYISSCLANKLIDQQRKPYQYYLTITGFNIMTYILEGKLLNKNYSISKITHNATMDTAGLIAAHEVSKILNIAEKKCAMEVTGTGIKKFLRQGQNLFISNATKAISLGAQYQLSQWVAEYQKYPYDK